MLAPPWLHNEMQDIKILAFSMVQLGHSVYELWCTERAWLLLHCPDTAAAGRRQWCCTLAASAAFANISSACGQRSFVN